MPFKSLFTVSFVAAIAGLADAALTRRVSCSDGNTATNAACCAWFPIRDDLQTNLFANECGHEAREALRLTFHDALGFSPTLGGGGADGSIITFSDTELTYASNADSAMDDIVDNLTPFVSKYNVTPGDLVFFAGALGFSNCAGATQLQFLTGRPNPTAASPDGLVSSPADSADTIIARFADAGLSSDELVALLASHSVGAADAVNGAPFDSTPAEFDSQFFVETSLTSTFPGALRIPSDGLLARDSRTACTWQGFVEDQSGMRSAFSAAFAKMAVLGQSTANLVDCTEVIPSPAADNDSPYFPGTLTVSDVDQSCSSSAFPTLTQNAAITSLASVAGN